MADAAPKPKTAFGVVMTGKPAAGGAAASAPQTSPRGGAKAPTSAAKSPPAAAGKAPAKGAPAVIKKAPAAKAPPPTSGNQAEGQLSSSIGVGKIASKFGKEDFVPAPAKPKPKPKPKVAAPAGASTAASKALFEKKMAAQKPTPKLGVQTAKFERKINAQTKAVEASKTKAPLPQRPAHSIAKQFEEGRAPNAGQTQKIAHSLTAAPPAPAGGKGVATGAAASPKEIASKLSAQAAANATPVTSKPPVIVRSQEPEEEAPAQEEAHYEEQPQEEAPAEEAPAEEAPAEEAPQEEAAPHAAGEEGGQETLPLQDANGAVVGSVTHDGKTFYNAAGGHIATVEGNQIYDGAGGALGSIGEDGHYYDSAGTDLGHMDGNQALNGAGELVGKFDGTQVTYSDDSLFGTADGVPMEAVAIFYFFFFAGGAQ